MIKGKSALTLRLYELLAVPERKGNRIGLFRIIGAIVGGLLVAFTAMTLLVLLLPVPIGEAVLLPFLFVSFIWACVALWISLAPSKLQVLTRSLVPSALFALGILLNV